MELDYYNFTALNHPPGHPARMAQDTFYVDPGASTPSCGSSRRRPVPASRPPGPRCHPGPRTSCCAPTPRRCRCGRWRRTEPPIFIVVPGRCYRSDPSTPPTARSSTRSRAWRSARGSPSPTCKGTLDEFARAIFGPERETRFRPGFFPFTEPSVEVDVSCFRCGGSGRAAGRLARSALQGHRLDRDPRLGNGGPERVRLRRRTAATTPSGSRASRSGWGSSGSRCSSTASPTCASSSRTTSGCWSSSDEGAVLLAARVLRSRSGGRGARPSCSRCAPPRSSGSRAWARPRATASWSARVLSVERHPDADRLSVCEVDDRRRRPGRSSAARPTSPPARPCRWPCPARCMPGGEELGRAKLRGVDVRRDDPLRGRARDRRRRGRDHGPRTMPRPPRSPPGARCGTGPGLRWRGAAGRRAGARARGQLEPGRLLRRVRRRAGGARVHRRAAGARRRGSEDAEAQGERQGLRLRLGHGRGARALPAVHRPRVHRRDDRPVAAVAEGAADRGRASGRSTTSSTSPTT